MVQAADPSSKEGQSTLLQGRGCLGPPQASLALSERVLLARVRVTSGHGVGVDEKRAWGWLLPQVALGSGKAHSAASPWGESLVI